MKIIYVTLILLINFSAPSFSEAVESISTVKIATAQFKIEGNQSNKDLFSKIAKLVIEAKNNDAHILLLPEWITLDRWQSTNKPSDQDIIQLIANETTKPLENLLKKLAVKNNMVIVGGTTALKEKDKIFNAAPIAIPDGNFHYHRKVHLTKWERDQGLSTGKEATTLTTPFGKLAVLICYDSEFPDLSLELMEKRPEILLIPSMTESASGVGRVRWSTQARVVEQTAYAAIAVTAGQTWKGWHHFGKAAILAPQLPGFNSVLAEGDGSSHELTYATVDLKKLRETRALSAWQPALDIKNRVKN